MRTPKRERQTTIRWSAVEYQHVMLAAGGELAPWLRRLALAAAEQAMPVRPTSDPRQGDLPWL